MVMLEVDGSLFYFFLINHPVLVELYCDIWIHSLGSEKSHPPHKKGKKFKAQPGAKL